MRPEVTIIMPVLNGEKYIGEAVQSILDQTYQDFELVIVNDGSTDGTMEVLQPYLSKADIKFVHHPVNQGVARSVNDGIRKASGRFIAFLDSDDLWFPTFLETQMAHLRANPDTGMVHSDFQTVDADGKVIQASVAICNRRVRVSGHVFPRLFMDSFVVGNSVLIRKECFDRLGGFDEVIRWGDYHMWLRIARHYKMDYTPKVLTTYRQHSSQNSRGFSVEDPQVEPAAVMAIRSILALYPEVRRELGEKVVNRRMATLHFEMAHYWFVNGARQAARAPLAKALALWPANPRIYLLYAATLLSPSLANAARTAWRAIPSGRPPVGLQDSGRV